MKKMCLILLAACLLLGGCAGANKKETNPSAQGMIVTADAADLQGEEGVYALYFRLGDTQYLAPEQRKLTVQRDETLEMALVRSLVEGPAATSAALTPLFPQGTQVLAVARQEGILFVTLNERFLSGYSAERGEGKDEEKQQALQKEKQLCLDALAATLTEAGLCSRVQVLIYRQQVQGNSLRLTEDYLYHNGSTLPLPVLTRNEESLYTPHNAAGRMLSAWMGRDFSQLLGCMSVQGRPAEEKVLEEMESAPALTSFTLSPGTVSADGTRAVVTVQMTLHQNGNDWSHAGFPLLLVREGGVWKVHYETLCSMMAKE